MAPSIKAKPKRPPSFTDKKPIYYVVCTNVEYEANDLTQVLKLWAQDGMKEVENVGRLG